MLDEGPKEKREGGGGKPTSMPLSDVIDALIATYKQCREIDIKNPDIVAIELVFDALPPGTLCITSNGDGKYILMIFA
jgi:hypothetical protein